jgi:predicted transposase YbfD/YdcC
MRNLFPPAAVTIEKAHGRFEKRSVQTSTALNDYLDFPYVGQVFRIFRTATNCKTGKIRQQTAYGVTSLQTWQADARQIGELARGQWQIENRLHWVRDVTFDEDRSQARTGAGPRVLASLRNFAISCLRLADCKSIARGLRCLSWNWKALLNLLGI